MTEVQKDSQNTNFAIYGDLRIQASKYSRGADKCAQVLCFADVSYNGQELCNVLLFKLDISGSQEDGWDVDEDFPYAILPYMKPVEAFRAYIIEQLDTFRSTASCVDGRSPWCPLWMGIGTYITRLGSFNETRALFTQLRGKIDHCQRRLNSNFISLKTQNELHELALSLLKTFGVSPYTERPFSIEGALD